MNNIDLDPVFRCQCLICQAIRSRANALNVLVNKMCVRCGINVAEDPQLKLCQDCINITSRELTMNVLSTNTTIADLAQLANDCNSDYVSFSIGLPDGKMVSVTIVERLQSGNSDRDSEDEKGDEPTE
jgi:hypothetical protein